MKKRVLSFAFVLVLCIGFAAPLLAVGNSAQAATVQYSVVPEEGAVGLMEINVGLVGFSQSMMQTNCGFIE